LHRQNLIINKDNCLRFIIAAIAVAKNAPGLATVIIFQCNRAVDSGWERGMPNQQYIKSE
jgi:hypothetical protein